MKNVTFAENDLKGTWEGNAGTLLQMTGRAETEQNKEGIASVSDNPALKGGCASHLVENHIEAKGIQKKIIGKELNVCEIDTSRGMLEVLNPEVCCVIAGAMNILPSDLKNNCNDILLEERVSTLPLQFIEDHMVPNNASLPNAMEVDLVSSNCNDSLTSDITNKGLDSLGEEGVNLTEGAKFDSIQSDAECSILSNSSKLMRYKSRRNNKANSKRESRWDESEPAQRNIPTSLQVSPIFTSDNGPSTSEVEGKLANRHSNEASISNNWRSNKPIRKRQSRWDQSEPAQRNISTSLQVAPVFTSDNDPSTSEVEDIQLVNRHSNEASISNNLILLAKEEGFSKNADADMENSNMSLDIDSNSNAVKSDMSHEIDSNSTEVKHTNTEQCGRQRKRPKKDASHSNSVACPSVPVVQSNTASKKLSFPVSDEVDTVREINIEASTCNNLMSEVWKESGLPADVHANSTQSDLTTKIKLKSVIVANPYSYSRRKTTHKGKQKDFEYSQYRSDLDRYDPSVCSSLVGPAEMQLISQYDIHASTNSSLIDLTKGKDMNSQDRDISHKKDTDSFRGEKLSSVETKNDKETNESLDHSNIKIEQLKKNTLNTSFLVVVAGDADISSQAFGSEKGSTHQSDIVSLPPSPIRGVVDDVTPPDLSGKQSKLLNSFREKGINFSFQIFDKASIDGSSVNHSEKACTSDIGAGSENGKSNIPEDNVPDCVYMCNPSKKNSSTEEKEVASSSRSHKEDVVSSEMIGYTVTVSPEKAIMTCSRRKLLVLDLNGLLADVTIDFRYAQNAHKRIGRKAVFKRPFHDDFLKFCFERYDVGVWSSRRKNNVEDLVDYLMQDIKQKPLFCWDQSKCTDTGYYTVDNAQKPLVLKELKKLWNKEEPDLPWEKGEYSPSNTLLVDDSPYKALCNPPYTAIFPCPYHFNDESDSSLGPGGDLRVYLEGLATAPDVQKYVHDHPFGQRAINSANPSWKFYLRIIERLEKSPAPI